MRLVLLVTALMVGCRAHVELGHDGIQGPCITATEAAAAEGLTKFVGAIQAQMSGQVDDLVQRSLATSGHVVHLFAPDDTAFAGIDLDDSKLLNVLTTHVVVDQIDPQGVAGDQLVAAASGVKLTVNLADRTVATERGAADIVATVRLCGGSRLSVINAVLMPPAQAVSANLQLAPEAARCSRLGDVVAALGELTTLVGLLFGVRKEERIQRVLEGSGPYTTFAPNNDAFLTANHLRLEALSEVLASHIVHAQLDPDSSAPQAAIALSGEQIVVDLAAGTVATRGSSAAITRAVRVCGGTVFVIDGVLEPGRTAPPHGRRDRSLRVDGDSESGPAREAASPTAAVGPEGHWDAGAGVYGWPGEPGAYGDMWLDSQAFAPEAAPGDWVVGGYDGELDGGYGSYGALDFAPAPGEGALYGGYGELPMDDYDSAPSPAETPSGNDGWYDADAPAPTPEDDMIGGWSYYDPYGDDDAELAPVPAAAEDWSDGDYHGDDGADLAPAPAAAEDWGDGDYYDDAAPAPAAGADLGRDSFYNPYGDDDADLAPAPAAAEDWGDGDGYDDGGAEDWSDGDYYGGDGADLAPAPAAVEDWGDGDGYDDDAPAPAAGADLGRDSFYNPYGDDDAADDAAYAPAPAPAKPAAPAPAEQLDDGYDYSDPYFDGEDATAPGPAGDYAGGEDDGDGDYYADPEPVFLKLQSRDLLEPEAAQKAKAASAAGVTSGASVSAAAVISSLAAAACIVAAAGVATAVLRRRARAVATGAAAPEPLSPRV